MFNAYAVYTKGNLLTPSLTATRDLVSKLVAKDMGSRQVECGDSTLCSITAPYTLPFKMFELMLFCNLYPKVLFLSDVAHGPLLIELKKAPLVPQVHKIYKRALQGI